MTKFIKTLLSIAGGCLVLGIILSIVGLCLGGRLTSIRVGWDNGPRVYYTDAFTDGEFGMFRADASGAPSAPVSYTHLRAHETGRNLVCRLLLEKKKKKTTDVFCLKDKHTTH